MDINNPPFPINTSIYFLVYEQMSSARRYFTYLYGRTKQLSICSAWEVQHPDLSPKSSAKKRVFSFYQNLWADLKYAAADSSQLNAWGRAAKHFSGLEKRREPEPKCSPVKALAITGGGGGRGSRCVQSVAATHESYKPVSLGVLCQCVRCMHATT